MAFRPTRSIPIAAIALLAATSLSACAVGPDYKRPAVDTGVSFKEAEGWKQAQPSDALERGQWWTVFGDPVLNDLENQVEVSNQTLARAEAAFRQAKALVEQNQASLFPLITANGSATRSKSAAGGLGGGTTSSQYGARLNASWDIDVWGRIRRSVEAAKDQAMASEADIANARLSAQITLASDYMQLREQDEAKRLIDQTIVGYAETVRISQNKFDAGVTDRAALLTAQTTLTTAQAQAVDIARTRAVLEHAIAVLTGQPPSRLTIAPLKAFTLKAPQIPVGLPSALLERRPDVAAAERTMAASNAQIGVAFAGYFPDLSLSGNDGFSSSVLSKLFSASANSWSIGASLTQTVFDAGATQGRVRSARAVYDENVATYRQTVLTALQQVEDAVAALRVLEVEEQLRYSASQQADEAERIANNKYVAGTTDYTTLVVAEATALSARTTAVLSTLQRLQSTVNLISALGGGWQTPAKAKFG